MGWTWMRLGGQTLLAGVALACAATAQPAPPASPPRVAAQPAPPASPPRVAAQPAPPASPPRVAAAPRAAPARLDARVLSAKGWGWLVDKLVADGVPRESAERAFADPRIPRFDGLYFNPDPAEPKSMYHAVLQSRSVAQARACRSEYGRAFEEAEERTGVPAELLAAILHVETRCGRNTGDSIVLFGLARLAMANEPENVERNVARRTKASKDPGLEQRVRARAAKLEEMFYPEVRAVFELADRWQRDPLSLRGSPSGAFGLPQFLPTSYLRFGADGNGDGRVDLYDIDDAATSAGWFLASHGWQGRPERAEQRRVIWHYNRSHAYIDAVLGLADRIGPGPRRGTLPVAGAAN